MRTLSKNYRMTEMNNGSEEARLRSLGWINVYGTEWEKLGIVASTPEMALNVEGWLERKES